ncbi:MAG: methylenetetrahydrofolate reductase [Bdellovibrio sp.]|nr:methylenetetrahydrofolate reductase [Bdellovibrio sp.]
MKVIEHINNRKGPLFSFEIVPPPRGRTVQDIFDIINALVPFSPSWIDVTAHSASAYYNERADGTVQRRIYKKRPGTIGICGIIQNRFNIDTVGHLLCNGFTKEETEDALIELNFLGVQNILAVRGDGLNYKKNIAKDRSVNLYASDLVSQMSSIKRGLYLDELSLARPLNFCVGVAGYPEKHFESPSLKQDLFYLKKKVEMGAEYIMTQMFFDNQKYFDFVTACRGEGITVPIIPGIKILKTKNQLQSIPSNFYIDLPDELVEEALKNPDHIPAIGIRWAQKQVEGLLKADVPDVHFYIMNDTELVVDVIKKFR